MRVIDSFPSKNCKMAIRTSVPMTETRSLRCCKPRVGKRSLSPHHQHKESASAPSLYMGGNPTHRQKHTHRASQVENGNHSPRAHPFSPLIPFPTQPPPRRKPRTRSGSLEPRRSGVGRKRGNWCVSGAEGRAWPGPQIKPGNPVPGRDWWEWWSTFLQDSRGPAAVCVTIKGAGTDRRQWTRARG